MRKYKTLPKQKAYFQVGQDSQQCICERCRTVFSDFHSRCPECGSHNWELYSEENPYTRMPLERFIQLCGHSFWLIGTVLFITLLWQTDSNDYEHNLFYIYMAILSIASGVLISALYFALSEIITRTMRMQWRLRAFHDHYRQRYPTVNTVKKAEIRTIKKVKTKAKKAVSIAYLMRVRNAKK